MKKGSTSGMPAIIVGAFIGLIFGCLITWYPIRLLFCAAYNTPDCEEIVLMAFPFYCFIAPLIGGVAAYLLYRRRREAGAIDSVPPDGTTGEGGGGEGR